MNFNEQLIITLIDNVVIGLLILFAGFIFNKGLGKFSHYGKGITSFIEKFKLIKSFPEFD